jgi:hypothetical protein
LCFAMRIVFAVGCKEDCVAVGCSTKGPDYPAAVADRWWHGFLQDIAGIEGSRGRHVSSLSCSSGGLRALLGGEGMGQGVVTGQVHKQCM